SLCGLGREKTAQVIQRLWEVGLIELPGMDRGAAENSAGPLPNGRADASSKAAPSLAMQLPVPIEDFDYDENLLAQTVELEDDFKRELLCVYSQLGDMSHYAFFGIPPEASRKEIRNAYYGLSKRYHPDLYFRRLLGDYGPMIEKVFQRATKAYKILSNPKKRTEYDASLSRGRTSHDTPIGASTLASQRSESREEIVSDRKREMAYTMLVQRGDDRLDQGDFTGAIDQFRKALSVKRDAALAIRVARTLFDDGERLDDALTFARVALKIDPKIIDAFQILGEIYEVKNSPDEAIFHYERALKLDPQRADLQDKISGLRT
ncbi:MAG: DnaJ domain-containing protein, partial [Bradymonadaceae bacterium]